jgi:hypothetical protein
MEMESGTEQLERDIRDHKNEYMWTSQLSKLLSVLLSSHYWCHNNLYQIAFFYV